MAYPITKSLTRLRSELHHWSNLRCLTACLFYLGRGLVGATTDLWTHPILLSDSLTLYQFPLFSITFSRSLCLRVTTILLSTVALVLMLACPTLIQTLHGTFLVVTIAQPANRITTTKLSIKSLRPILSPPFPPHRCHTSSVGLPKR